MNTKKATKQIRLQYWAGVSRNVRNPGKRPRTGLSSITLHTMLIITGSEKLNELH